LRLLKLPDDIQQLLQIGRISTGHARTLLGAEHPDVQRRIARKVIEQDLSVRATEQMVRKAGEAAKREGASAKPRTQEVDANVRAAESKLRRRFGTRVRIVQAHGSSAGRIELEFYTQFDLNRLFDLLSQPSAV
jgi:ParB family chromosome partitioning protein